MWLLSPKAGETVAILEKLSLLSPLAGEASAGPAGV
jgi:hypothetical protein